MKNLIEKLKEYKKEIAGVAIVFASMAAVVSVVLLTPAKVPDVPEARAQYYCDKQTSFSFVLDVEKVNEDIEYNIRVDKSDLSKDNLMMTDTDDKKVAYTDVNGGQCRIYVDGELQCLVSDNISGETSRTIWNDNTEKIATFTTSTILGYDGNVWAKKSKTFPSLDYVISVYDECPLDDETILLIFASQANETHQYRPVVLA